MIISKQVQGTLIVGKERIGMQRLRTIRYVGLFAWYMRVWYGTVLFVVWRMRVWYGTVLFVVWRVGISSAV
jgi:hypothetical protein